MKIRAASNFYSTLSKDEVMCQLLDDFESDSFPQKMSNNECSAAVGQEDNSNDSPLSFLVKFKAGNVSPSKIPNGVSGIEIPSDLKHNIKHNDNMSPFTSVNINHHDLQIASDKEFQTYVNKIISTTDFLFGYDLSTVIDYITNNLEETEWIGFFKNNAKWNKFKNKALVNRFTLKHCDIEQNALRKYLKGTHDGLEEDLHFLHKNNAVTDTNKLKTLKNIFPHIFQ